MGRQPRRRRPKPSSLSEPLIEDEIDAVRALEAVHASLARVDAYAQAAVVALDAIPRAEDPEARRRASHLYAYVIATGEAAEEVLAEAGELVTRVWAARRDVIAACAADRRRRGR